MEIFIIALGTVLLIILAVIRQHLDLLKKRLESCEELMDAYKVTATNYYEMNKLRTVNNAKAIKEIKAKMGMTE